MCNVIFYDMSEYSFNKSFIADYASKEGKKNYDLRKLVNGNASSVARWMAGGDLKTDKLITLANKLNIDILNFFFKDGELMSDVDHRKDVEIVNLKDKVRLLESELAQLKENAEHIETLSANMQMRQQEITNLLRDLLREQSDSFERKEEQMRLGYQKELRDKDDKMLQLQIEKNEELLRAKEEILRLKDYIAKLKHEN